MTVKSDLLLIYKLLCVHYMNYYTSKLNVHLGGKLMSRLSQVSSFFSGAGVAATAGMFFMNALTESVRDVSAAGSLVFAAATAVGAVKAARSEDRLTSCQMTGRALEAGFHGLVVGAASMAGARLLSSGSDLGLGDYAALVGAGSLALLSLGRMAYNLYSDNITQAAPSGYMVLSAGSRVTQEQARLVAMIQGPFFKPNFLILNTDNAARYVDTHSEADRVIDYVKRHSITLYSHGDPVGNALRAKGYTANAQGNKIEQVMQRVDSKQMRRKRRGGRALVTLEMAPTSAAAPKLDDAAGEDALKPGASRPGV